MADNFLKQMKITRVSNAVAAGTTEIDCTSVDMLGFESVIGVAAFGTLTSGAVTALKWQGSTDNSTWSDLTGTALSIADTADNKLLVSELVKPLYRYVRLVITRGTANAVLDSATCYQYGARVLPTTNDTTVAASEQNFSPAAGTA